MINRDISILPYDKYSAQSIFEYSEGLIDHILREYIWEGYQVPKGKGSLGQMVENIYFLLETNSNPSADFSEAGLELKCTPLKLNKQNEELIKERLSCNMINYFDVVKEDFENSHFYLKCKLLLILFYLYQQGEDNLDLKFLYSVLWKLPEKDLLIIKHDYEVIVGKIKQGEAHLLSEGDTMYLGACRKGQKGDPEQAQPYSEITAPKRAFCLKMTYMRTILEYIKDSGKKAAANFPLQQKQIVSLQSLRRNSFDDIVLKRFAPYYGKKYQSLAKKLGIDLSRNPKNKFAMIASSIASKCEEFNVNKSEEFLKAGLTMKTIRVKADSNIVESMSFENINYQEVADCEDWYESRLYELYSSRFLFVIFKEKTLGAEDYILDDAFFWTMPQADLLQAEAYWEHIRGNVLADHIGQEYWWKSSDGKKFHVRPKASKASDLVLTPKGSYAKKYCYWFNNDYVKEIVSKRQYIRNGKKEQA